MTGAQRSEPGLLVGACALIFLAMVTSFAPTPLYPLYQEAWHVSDVHISIAFAAYPVGVVCILLLFGGLSDRIGRRNTLLLGAAVLAIALLTLGFAPNYPTLVLGRLLHGFASGLATGAAAAALMESHPRGLAAGAFVNTLCLATGMAAGPLLSGALADVTTHPRLFPFLAIAVGLLVPVAILLRMPPPPPPVHRVRLIQPLGVPRELWFPFTISAAAIVAANGGMGIFGSFGTEIASTIGWDSQTRTGWLVSGVLALLAGAQVCVRSLAPTTTMAIGASAATAGWFITALGAGRGDDVMVVTGSLVVGAASGMCLLGSAGFIGVISPPHRRAEIYSAFLVIAFGSLGLTALGAGPVIEQVSIHAALWSSTTIAGALTIWVFVSTSRLRR